VKPIKNESLLAGLTAEAPDGKTSLPVMKDGNEPPDMLLALLNNVLPSMTNSQQAEIVGTGMINNKQATIVFFYGVVPTANKTLALVGNVEAV
jgi:hypothetical protein